MIGCKSHACRQGREACPHPAKCWTKNGGGGSVGTPATSFSWVTLAVVTMFMGMAAGGLAGLIAGALAAGGW